MTQPLEVDYQAPLPHGYRLRYLINDQAVHISRDPVGKTLLWMEAAAPLILLIIFAVSAALIWKWTDHPAFRRTWRRG